MIAARILPALAAALLAAATAAGCGAGTTEVWLKLEESDSSRPCLGASHLQLVVQNSDGSPGPRFDELGLFFDKITLGCRIEGELRYPDLEPGNDLTVLLSLYDSSTAAEGLLAEAVSRPFSVSGGAPIQEVTVSLYRRPGVQQGTVIVYQPRDWGVVSGIAILRFRVVKDGATTATRDYYVAYDPKTIPDPFPVVISNLPAPPDMELYHFYLEGQDANQNPLRVWTAPIFLQQGTVFDLQM